MSQSQIFLPCVALAVLTAIVWIRLYVERIGEMRARRIRPQALASAREVTQALQNVNAADNFRNLFEVPVLFYVLCISLTVTQLVTPLDIGNAWGFVALRAAHSLIHLTYNRVMHRFMVYAASTVLVFIMWVSFGVRLLSAQ
jgi:hypothetical protein